MRCSEEAVERRQGSAPLEEGTDTDHQAVRRAYGDGVPVVRPGMRRGADCLLEEREARYGEKASYDESYQSITDLRNPEERS